MPPTVDNSLSSGIAAGGIDLRAENLRLEAENTELRALADRVADANAYAAEMVAELELARAELQEKERCLARDVIELKNAQEALKRLHRQTQLILNSAGEGICGVDLEGSIVFASPASGKLLGRKVEELLGHSLHHVSHHTKEDGIQYPVHRSTTPHAP